MNLVPQNELEIDFQKIGNGRPRGRPYGSLYCNNPFPNALPISSKRITKGRYFYNPGKLINKCLYAIKHGHIFRSDLYIAGRRSNEALGVSSRLKMNPFGERALCEILIALLTGCNLGYDGKVIAMNLTKLNELSDLQSLSRSCRAMKNAVNLGFVKASFSREKYNNWRFKEFVIDDSLFLACGCTQAEIDDERKRAIERNEKREKRAAERLVSQREFENRLYKQKLWKSVNELKNEDRKKSRKAKREKAEAQRKGVARFNDKRKRSLRSLELRGQFPNMTTDEIKRRLDDEFGRSTD